ncbi:MAG TPA: hypothetical protein VNQ90_06855 [Chthoniobacteraceae bacterium]|nr:hypothetical protein [Chthoniobacteraceae bacterium]
MTGHSKWFDVHALSTLFAEAAGTVFAFLTASGKADAPWSAAVGGGRSDTINRGLRLTPLNACLSLPEPSGAH